MLSTIATVTRCPLADPHAPHNRRKEKEKQRTAHHQPLGVTQTLISLLNRLSLAGQRAVKGWASRKASGSQFQSPLHLLSQRKVVPKQELDVKKSGVVYVLFHYAEHV